MSGKARRNTRGAFRPETREPASTLDQRAAPPRDRDWGFVLHDQAPPIREHASVPGQPSSRVEEQNHAVGRSSVRIKRRAQIIRHPEDDWSRPLDTERAVFCVEFERTS